MSQTSKRPGARDISELKARLGLKKSGSAARKPTAGGVVPPPGTKIGGAVPPPPGAQTPAPPAPHIPNAAEDPFGAMNALAAGAAQQAAPQIVVVNDGKPVESVEQTVKAARYAKIGGIVLVPLILGVVIGQISSRSKAYNRTIDDAALIRDDVKNVGKSLIDLQQVLQVAKERGAGGNNFLVGDQQLTEELEALTLVQPNIEVVYASYLFEMDPDTVAGVLSFYSETALVTEAVKNHIEASKSEAKILKEGQVKMEGFNPFQYAALLEKPAGEGAENAPVAFKLVQIGTPVCQGQTTPSEAGCQGPPAGFRYRLDEQGPWGVKKLASMEGETISTDSLVLLNPGTKVLEQVLKGGKATVAEAAYTKRITDLETKVNEMVELRKRLSERLTAKANEGKKFTFFM